MKIMLVRIMRMNGAESYDEDVGNARDARDARDDNNNNNARDGTLIET